MNKVDPSANQKARHLNAINVQVNDKPVQLANGRTVAQLLKELTLRGGPVAVELNQELVPGDQFDSVELSEGDYVEVVSLTGGG